MAISAFDNKSLNEMINKQFSLIPFKLFFRVKICVYSYHNSFKFSPYAELCSFIQDVDLVRIRPPPNMDVAKLKAVLKDYSCEGVPKAWTKLEKDELLKGLKQQIQESRMRTAMETFK